MIRTTHHRARWLILGLVAACGTTTDDIQCATGTELVGTQCLPVHQPCPMGTHDDGGLCADDPVASYEIRIAEATMGANGHTKREVLVLGTDADGSPATDDVILGIDRAGAGSYTDATLTLGPAGARSLFIPCDRGAADCLGPATLTVALASAPATPVARVDVELVEPTEVSSLAPCRGPDDVFFLDGNDYIRQGRLRVTDATWFLDGISDWVRVSVFPDDQIQGNGWDAVFDTSHLPSPLAPGVYLSVVRTPVAGEVGMSVSGNAHACNTITGSFQIHEYVRTGTTVTAMTATFEQHCEGDPTTLLEGCLRYGAP